MFPKTFITTEILQLFVLLIFVLVISNFETNSLGILRKTSEAYTEFFPNKNNVAFFVNGRWQSVILRKLLRSFIC